jgi:hypothetical protein
MSKRSDDEKLDVQSQKKVKLSSQEIEVSSSAQQTELKASPIFSWFAFLFFIIYLFIEHWPSDQMRSLKGHLAILS